MIDQRPVTELAEPLAAAPAQLTKPCANPVLLPDAGLSRGQTKKFWGQDRAALSSCGAGKEALVGFINRRDKGLAGK